MEPKVSSDKPPCLCDACGANMRDSETGETMIGLVIHLPKSTEDDITIPNNQKELDRVLDTFGKTHFNICFVCLLKALGVKAKNG